MLNAEDMVELTHDELVQTIVIILRADTSAIPVMRGKGSTHDTFIRDYQTERFAEHLATCIRQHARCFKHRSGPLHSAG